MRTRLDEHESLAEPAGGSSFHSAFRRARSEARGVQLPPALTQVDRVEDPAAAEGSAPDTVAAIPRVEAPSVALPMAPTPVAMPTAVPPPLIVPAPTPVSTAYEVRIENRRGRRADEARWSKLGRRGWELVAVTGKQAFFRRSSARG